MLPRQLLLPPRSPFEVHSHSLGPLIIFNKHPSPSLFANSRTKLPSKASNHHEQRTTNWRQEGRQVVENIPFYSPQSSLGHSFYTHIVHQTPIYAPCSSKLLQERPPRSAVLASWPTPAATGKNLQFYCFKAVKLSK